MTKIVKQVLFLGMLCLQGAWAQTTITGQLSPEADFKWIIAYELTPTAQRYVADAEVTEGDFTLTLPANSVPGTYRLVYGVPQDTFYMDVLYSGKEDIALHFSWDNGLSFTASEENKVYQGYQEAMADIEAKILDFYTNNATDASRFLRWIQQQDSIQATYESQAEGLLAATFIRAEKPYLPEAYEPFGEYMAHRKAHFFEHVPLGDAMVQASGFLFDKVTAHTFTAPSDQAGTPEAMTEALKANVDDVAQQLKETPMAVQTQLFHKLWKVAQQKQFFGVADHIFHSHLSGMALATDNTALVDEVAAVTRLRVGNLAPAIAWEDEEGPKSLATMEPAETYLLVFWSSTCSHCLQEVPQLHETLLRYPNVKVLAIGLEDALEPWQSTTHQFPNFEHALALDKWESAYAKTYAIQSTPTYIFLDERKRILSKPLTYQEVLSQLKAMQGQ